jgi:hypothetical protein
MRYPRFIAVLVGVVVCSFSPNAWANQPGGVMGGLLGGTVPELLAKADVVAIIFVDAGQTAPSLVHGTIRDSVKGIQKGAEICIVLGQHPIPPIGNETLLFLSRTSDPLVGNRISSCSGAASAFKVLLPPYPVADTYEVRSCITSPGARAVYCDRPPCSKARTVLFPAGAIGGLRSAFPTVCYQRGADAWIPSEELLEVFRKLVGSP